MTKKDEKQSLPNKRQLASTTDLEAIEKSPAALRPPPYPEPIPVAGGERSDVSAERRPSEEHVIKLSRRTAWVTVVGLILLIGGLVGGLAGGLISKYSHGGESTPSSTTHQSSGISTPTTAITTSTSTFSESTFTTAVAPSPYPSILSSKNLVQNALFEKGFEYWSDQQDCWQTTYDPSGTEDDVEMIARVYNNDANPGSPCPLTQTILTAGSGKFSLSFLYGTYFDNAADVSSDLSQTDCIQCDASTTP